MSLRDTNNQEKLAVSAIWLDPSRDRPIWESHVLLKAGLDALEPVHQRLLVTQQQLGTAEKQIVELTQEITETDTFHDRKGRGVHSVLTGGAELATSDADAASFDDILRTLYPMGLAIVRASYNQQTGMALQVREKLTPERRAFLAGITVVGGQSLLDETLAWLDAAKKIGELVDERAKLTGDDDDAITRGDLHRASLDWIRAVNDLIRLLDIARVAPDTRRRLLANLQETERRAIARRRRSSGGTSQPDVVLDDDLPEVPEIPETPEVVVTDTL